MVVNYSFTQFTAMERHPDIEEEYKTDVSLKRERSQTFVIETERERASKGEIKKNVVKQAARG